MARQSSSPTAPEISTRWCLPPLSARRSGAGRFLLDPLVAPTQNGNSHPAGTLLADKIKKSLQRGHSIVLFSESAVGVPAYRCRFRLDAFRAAASLHCAIIPIGITGTAELFDSNRSSKGHAARVEVGEPLEVAYIERTGDLSRQVQSDFMMLA